MHSRHILSSVKPVTDSYTQNICKPKQDNKSGLPIATVISYANHFLEIIS